jgi:hypothetical protein
MTTMTDYITKEFGEFVGKTVASIRPLTSQEIDGLYWEGYDHKPAFVIIFTDGTCLIPSADEEGNGPGFLLAGGVVS